MRIFRPILWLLTFWLLTLPAAAAQDYWQREMKWPAQPRRILSLSPATTEMMYAVGADKQLIGVTNDCNYPAAAAAKPKVGPFGKFQLEAIVKLKPDLILVTADMGQALTPLRRLSVPVLAFSTPDVGAIQRNLIALGRLTGHAPTAQTVVQNFQTRLQAVQQDKVPARSVFYLVWDAPLITASPGSFIGNVLSLSGGRNVVGNGSAPFLHYSLESLLKANPQVMILPRSVAGRLHLNAAPYNRLQAIQRQRLLTVDDDLISRPGPRVIQAIEKIHAFLKGLKP